MTYVYLHIFPDGKVYVGIADNPAQRWKGGAGYKDNPAMYAAIIEYGWRNIDHKIIAECQSREEALTLEREYIILYDSENPDKGYNQTGVKADLLAKVEARNSTFEGFGEHRSAADWARIAHVPRTTFWRYLKQGMTVEEIFELRHIVYKGPQTVKVYRKPRQSAAMKETQEIMYTILFLSGYILDVDKGMEQVEVTPGGNQTHLITFEGQPFGVYNYKTGALKLSGKTGIPLKLPGLEDPRVRRNSLGLWEPHPKTNAEVFRLKHPAV